MTGTIEAHDQNQKLYRTIPLEGETLCGRGLGLYNNGHECTATQEQLDLILSESPIDQLKKWGFTEHVESPQYIQEKREKKLQNLLKNKESYEKSIIGYQERLQNLQGLFTTNCTEPINPRDEAMGKAIISDIERSIERMVVGIKEIKEQIEAFETRGVLPLVEQTRIYIKEIPDEINHQHKVFLVKCEGNEVDKVFTTVYQSDEREKNKIQGDIIDFISVNHRFSTFILQEAQKKFEAKFQWRDSERHHYFTVFCQPMNG